VYNEASRAVSYDRRQPLPFAPLYRHTAQLFVEIMGGDTHGPPADVYSFAVTLWETLSLRKPYPRIRSVKSAINQVLKRNVRPQLSYVADDAVREVVQMAWHPDPCERPSFELIVCYFETILAENGTVSPCLDRRNTSPF